MKQKVARGAVNMPCPAVYAASTAWDERAGRVSRAFNDWYLVNRDQRAFFSLGLRFARASCERLWAEAGSEPADPDGSELVDVFDERIEGLWPHDYEWMHSAAVIRDAVTSYEVYLVKAREEVLQHHGHPQVVPDRAPYWPELEDFFTELGAKIETPGVKGVRDLRNFLVHRRGELRSEAERKEFTEKTDDLPPLAVELPDDEVIASLDALGRAVRTIDPIVYQHTWGGTRLHGLLPAY